MTLSGSAEPAFLVNGFTNWKDATRNFSKHKSCDFYKLAAAALTSQVDTGEMFSKQYVDQLYFTITATKPSGLVVT